MSTKSLTFQQALVRCEAGDREAWRFFLSNYTPIALRLLDFYLPRIRGDEQEDIWREALAALAAGNYQRLRTFDHLSEREFLMDLRDFLLEFGGARLDPAGDVPGVPRPTAESVAALLKDLPFAHQEIVFLTLAGHSDAATEKLSGVPSSIARQALENLEAQYAPVLRREEDTCPWPAAWLEMLGQARAARTPECVARRLLVRIRDGQTTWYEKSPAEEHIAHCLHCLQAWIALREVHFLRDQAQPLTAEKVDHLLSCLPIAAPAASNSFLRGWFGS
jgi:hypothetical protein